MGDENVEFQTASYRAGLGYFGIANFRRAAPAAPAKDDNKKSSSGFEFNKKDPIYITADWMEVDQKKNSIVYKGRVVTVQADMTMSSDALTAYYDPEMKEIQPDCRGRKS